MAFFSSTAAPTPTVPDAAVVTAMKCEKTAVPHVDELLLDRAPRESCVMIVDDEEINVEVVQAYLEEEGFSNFVTTTDSREAINLAHVHRPDVVLLDINMPHVNGLEILRGMRMDASLKRIPTVILTAETGGENKLKALRLGATDFLAKPVDPSELMLRLENVLAAKVYHDTLQDYSEQLERQVIERTADLENSRREAIECLARAAEYRDDVTGRHVVRVGRYSKIIAVQMGFDKYRAAVLESAAQLHDLGKIGIPDAILNKPGKLTDEEYDIIKTHCVIGYNVISPPASENHGRTRTHDDSGHALHPSETSSPVLILASTIAATHHEKWNGRGYPNGLSGEDIPIEGRIVAVADVFDALTSKRCYKDPISKDQCFDILREGRGEHFDPQVIDAFFAVEDQIMAAWDNLRDPE